MNVLKVVFYDLCPLWIPPIIKGAERVTDKTSFDAFQGNHASGKLTTSSLSTQNVEN